MKKSLSRYAIFACIIVLGFACSRSEKLQGNEFLIEGKLSGIEDGTVVMLFRAEGRSATSIASDTVKDGRFKIISEAASDLEKLLVFYVRENKNTPYPLYVWVTPKAKVKIKGEGEIIPLWDVKSSVPSQKEENRFINIKRDLIIENHRMMLIRDELSKKIRTASSNEETDEYRQTLNTISNEITQINEKEYFSDISILEKTDISPVWLKKMQQIIQSLRSHENLRPKAWELFGRMSEEDKNTPDGAQIIAALTPYNVVGIGDNMADANLLDINGNTKRLSDYLGKYLLLDFWSAGCAPCIRAFPTMKEILETYHDKLTIISVSIDSDTMWKEAMNTHNTPWVNLREPNSWSGLSASYGVMSIPNYVLISPEGKIVDKWAGSGELNKKMNENIK